jgi:hypothetical protein
VEYGGTIDATRTEAARLGSAWPSVSARDWLVLAGIILLSFATYAITLNDWFWGDDVWFLRSSGSNSFFDYALKSLDFRETGSLPEFDRYRPLYPIVWRAQFALFGLDAMPYHAVVLALHLANTVLVWLIALRVTRLTWAAALAAAVFTFHPAYTDAIVWLSGANRAFVTFPYLLSFLAFIWFWDATGRLKWLWLAVSVLAFIAAILMHSAAITLALVLPAYAFLVGSDSAERWKQPLSWAPFVPFGAISVALLGIQLWVRDHLGISGQFEFGWHQYSVYGNYFGRALFPVFPIENDFVDDYLRTTFEAVEGLASVALFALCVGLIVQRWNRRLGAFAVIWFVLALFPDSTLRFLTSGRALYLAAPALAIMISVITMWADSLLSTKIRPLAEKAALAVAVVLLILSVPLTIHHADTQGNAGEQNRRFVQELTESIEGVPRGGVLYVAGAPANLVVFDDTRFKALVALYSGPVDVRLVGAAELPALRDSLTPQDRVFEFHP